MQCVNPGCRKLIARHSSFCAYCGATTTRPRYGRWLAAAALVVLLAGGWVSWGQRYLSAQSQTSQSPRPQIVAGRSEEDERPVVQNTSAPLEAGTYTAPAAAATSTTAGRAGVEETAAESPTMPADTNLTSLATASASSVLAPEQTACCGLVFFSPDNVLDRDLDTSWVEGVPGPGIGQQLVIQFARPVTIGRIGLDVGYDRDAAIFFANHRVRRVRLTFSDGSTQHINFRDRRGMQFATLAAVTTSTVALTIEDIYPGSKYDDTPIAEVEVWGYEAP